MTDKELKDAYDISDDVIEMLRDCCDVDEATNVDLIYTIANIKILQQRLAFKGYTPDINGCRSFVLKRTCESVVEDALRCQ